MTGARAGTGRRGGSTVAALAALAALALGLGACASSDPGAEASPSPSPTATGRAAAESPGRDPVRDRLHVPALGLLVDLPDGYTVNDVHLVDVTTGEVTQLTDDAEVELQPAWRPNEPRSR